MKYKIKSPVLLKIFQIGLIVKGQRLLINFQKN